MRATSHSIQEFGWNLSSALISLPAGDGRESCTLRMGPVRRPGLAPQPESPLRDQPLAGCTFVNQAVSLVIFFLDRKKAKQNWILNEIWISNEQ